MAAEPVTAIANATGQLFGFLGTIFQPPRQEVVIYDLEKRRGEQILGAFIIGTFILLFVLMYFAFKKV